jgi:hypothetical protein
MGAALVAGAWLFTRGVPALARNIDGRRARTEAAVRSLIAAREAAREAAWLRDTLASRAERLLTWAPRLLSGGTGAEATATLQSLVTGLAATHRVRIVRVDPGAAVRSGDFLEATLRLEAQGDVAGIAGWLSAIEEGETLLAVRQVQLNSPEPAAPAHQPELLRANLTITGWAAVSAPRAP